MSLKATSKKDVSDAIVLSFDARWHEKVLKGRVRTIFRKRGPSNPHTNWIYAYFGSPEKVISGRFRIIEFSQSPISKCLQLSEKGGISKAELKSYAADYESLFAFIVDDYERAPSPIPYSVLNLKYQFTAPQSFIVLSREGKMIIDRIFDFPNP